MTVDQHRVIDGPHPGGARQEIIRGTLTLSSGTATESINLNLSYNEQPDVQVTAVQGSTTEDVNATVNDADPTSDGTVGIRLSGTTDEDKDYRVVVTSPVGEAQ